MEREYLTTDSPDVVAGVLTSQHGKAAGVVGKTYYVYWPEESEHTTVCCYSISHVEIPYPDIIVEVETTTSSNLEKWERSTVRALQEAGLNVRPEPKSLFELFVLGERNARTLS